MEVILKEDVNKLGHRGDVVKVADGYGRNYLLPQKLAMEATAANKVVIEQMKQAAVRRSAKEKSEAELLVNQLNQVELTFERRVGENEHLFGSVTAGEIAQAAGAQGLYHRPPQAAAGRAVASVGRVPRAGEVAPRSDRAHQGHGQGRRSRLVATLIPVRK